MNKLTGILLLLTACTHEVSKTTHTNSASFSTSQEKVRFLTTYLTPHSEIRNAKYVIDYRDNSQGILAGPSDYTMAVALKINKDSVDYWLKGLKKEDFTINLDLWKEVELKEPTWMLPEKQELFTGTGETKAVYREAGIILTHYTTTPIDTKKYKK
jgi:hypothetical protein